MCLYRKLCHISTLQQLDQRVFPSISGFQTSLLQQRAHFLSCSSDYSFAIMIDVLMICVGSRGDVQPYVVLARALMQAGRSVLLAAHPEHEGFVQQAGVLYAPVRGSIPEALASSEAGKRMRQGKGGIGVAVDFFSPLAQLWFDDAVSLTLLHGPCLVLLSLMPWFLGGHRLQEMIEARSTATTQSDTTNNTGTSCSSTSLNKPVIVVSSTVPGHVTSAFLPPSVGLGLTAPLGVINRLVWWATSAAGRSLLKPVSAKVAAAFSLPHSNTTFRDYDQAHKPLTLYCYSSALIPKPTDWPSHVHVVGPWLPHGSYTYRTDSSKPTAAEQTPTAASSSSQGELVMPSSGSAVLPEDVTAYISAARSAGAFVLYIGLGSMLDCMFDAAEASRMLEVLAEAVQLLQAQHKCYAIIHSSTATQPHHHHQAEAEGASLSSQPSGATEVVACQCIKWLTSPVDHSVLFPLVDLVAHHGGMGTTHSALAAGVPALVLPVAQQADQPFWGALLQSKGAGQLSKQPATKITAAQLAKQLCDMLRNLQQYRQAARQLAEQMEAADGTSNAVQLIGDLLT